MCDCFGASYTGPSRCAAVAVSQAVDWVVAGQPFCIVLRIPTVAIRLRRQFEDLVRSQDHFELVLAIQDWSSLIANLTRDLREREVLSEMVCDSGGRHWWVHICADNAKGKQLVLGTDEFVDVQAQLQG